MNRKKATLNISIGIIARFITLFIALLSKSFVVRVLGNEANGLYSLYVSILGVLSIANLGIGTAISFSMYKPIHEGNKDQISALYYLYRKFYFIILLIMLGAGLLLTPVVPYFAKDHSGDINIYITYVVFLISVILTYTFGHKLSFINAYKDNYVTTIINAIKLVVEGVLQIVVIILTKNFLYFLLIRILANVLEFFIVEYVFNKKYRRHINKNKDISDEIRKEVSRNSKALMMYKIGGTLINTFDSIIIGAFVSIDDLGLFSNYVLIITSMNSIINLFFSEITSIMGHQYVSGDKEKFYNQFKMAYIMNFMMGIVFYLGYFSISHHLIEIIFTNSQIIPNNIVIVITISYFVNFMRGSLSLFKSASGLFHYDRFRPLIEGVINIVLSIWFVKMWGVIGVLIATIITRLSMSYITDVFVLFKHRFEKNMFRFYPIHYMSVASITILIFLFNYFVKFNVNNIYLDLLIKGSISVMLSLMFFGILYLISTKFRGIIKDILKNVFKKRKKAEHEKI